MDMPGVFYHPAGAVAASAAAGTGPGNGSSSYYSLPSDIDMFPGDQGASTDGPSHFPDWFHANSMDFRSSDSPDLQQGQAAASVARGAGGGVMQPMQPRGDLQQDEGGMEGVQLQMNPHQLQLQQPHPLFMPPPIPPFLNYDSMGLMPAGSHHLSQQQLQHQHQLEAASAAALFSQPQLFPACIGEVSSNCVPSSSASLPFLSPFDHMSIGQLPLTHHSSPSAITAHPNQMQHLMQPHPSGISAAAVAAATAAALHPYSASASDSSSQITTVLMAFRQGGEETEFVRKAIESLVKKLKDKRLELEALIQAVTSNGKTPTPCVTIQRSLDGRLQVAGRKGVPHVVYARIWRWPKVAKMELAKLAICQITSDNQDFICINPYHYERVVSNSGGGSACMTPAAGVDQQTGGSCSSGSSNGSSGGAGPGGKMPRGGGAGAAPFEASEDWSAQMPPAAAASIQTELRMAQQQQPPSVSDAAEYRNSIFPSNDGPIMHRSHAVDLNRVQIPTATIYPTHWCTINYFEHDTQVGETCMVRREMMSITVDGGLDPQGERNGRFCVGSLPNVHRQSAVEVVRMHIGAGVTLKQHQDGRVTMEVRSNKAIFVRAPYVDYVRHTPYASTIHKFTQLDGEITIFDLRWAYYEMREQTESAKNAVLAQARAVAGLPVNHPGMQQMSEVVAGSGVDEMKRMFCAVGMSFVKGFGGAYTRKTIKDCPCWIEVELSRPLQLLDQLLKKSYIF